MQEIHSKTRAPMLRDLLDKKRLNIACQRSKNMRSLLMQKKTMQNTTHKTSPIELHCLYRSWPPKKHRNRNEHIKLQQEISKINEVSKERNKMLCFNPYTKNHQWTRSTNQTTTWWVFSRGSNSVNKREKRTPFTLLQHLHSESKDFCQRRQHLLAFPSWFLHIFSMFVSNSAHFMNF